MNQYTYITLREKPELKTEAVAWFHDKWKVPQEAYLECMEAYLNRETEYGWYLCLDNEHIIGGLGVIENDFQTGKTLHPMYVQYIPKKNIVAGKLQDNCWIWL